MRPLHPPKSQHLRAAIEIGFIGFIVFLFYSHLLMGEFTVAAGRNKTLPAALLDIFTVKTFAIALTTSVLGHLGFDWMRKQS